MVKEQDPVKRRATAQLDLHSIRGNFNDPGVVNEQDNIVQFPNGSIKVGEEVAVKWPKATRALFGNDAFAPVDNQPK